jgi:hypothetical protein
MNWNINCEPLGVIERVERIVAQQVATHVVECIVGGITGKEGLGLKAGVANLDPDGERNGLSRSRSSSVEER